MLARWIGRAWGEPPPGITVQFAHESFSPSGQARPTKTARAPAYFTRAFCQTCNNGWMSRLEDQIRPVLEPMLRGLPRRTTLSLEDQRLLAFWATKTALAFQTMEDDETTWARPEDFATLFGSRVRSRTPRSGWVLAKSAMPLGYRSHNTCLSDTPDGEIDGFGVVLSVGFAVFWVLVPYEPRAQLRLFGEAGMATKPIHPCLGRSVVWPPPRTIVPIDLTGLPERLIQSSRLLPLGQ